MLPDRYTVANLKRAIRNPEKFREELARLPFTAHAVLQNAWAGLNGYGERDAVSLLDEDWDNLILIDACRADLFEETLDTDEYDEYRRVISVDSNTTPWSIKNFKGRKAGDTVYVTGNPGPSKTVPDEFHEFIEVWLDRDAHDENSYTVPAESVVEYAREAAESYPNKRLIVHFVQPHAPFVPNPELIYRTHWSDAERVGIEVEDPEPPHTVWEAVELGQEDPAAVWKGYQSNLEYVMDAIETLISDLSGRTVITSDHGNMMGERTITGRRIYGHPGGIRTRELVEVPWAVIDKHPRKEIHDDGVQSEGSMDDDLIEDRLAALGYVE